MESTALYPRRPWVLRSAPKTRLVATALCVVIGVLPVADLAATLAPHWDQPAALLLTALVITGAGLVWLASDRRLGVTADGIVVKWGPLVRTAQWATITRVDAVFGWTGPTGLLFRWSRVRVHTRIGPMTWCVHAVRLDGEDDPTRAAIALLAAMPEAQRQRLAGWVHREGVDKLSLATAYRHEHRSRCVEQ